MKMQIFEKDKKNEIMLQKLKDEQVRFEDAKRVADLKRKKLREMKESNKKKEEQAKASRSAPRWPTRTGNKRRPRRRTTE